ncbi:hypothetical protein AVEN_163215-1 [Araneus ventricosus]|uniref:Uncharacterized protein n=1 Tax=Araneus ventricosus TaxID=182803 RepID=A0A4Y2NZ08_ARAVE|nr:hypothetical protein AVEN_41686-1 [Araneus ventricosus]GBN44869.1 hypothetical protein AVEN_163215-1 [Araneus ventricosus]
MHVWKNLKDFESVFIIPNYPSGGTSNVGTRSRRRSLAPEEREEIIKSLEDPISQNLLPVNDSDDDNIDDIEAEFVHVSDEEVPASLPVPAPEPVPMHVSHLCFALRKVFESSAMA